MQIGWVWGAGAGLQALRQDPGQEVWCGIPEEREFEEVAHGAGGHRLGRHNGESLAGCAGAVVHSAAVAGLNQPATLPEPAIMLTVAMLSPQPQSIDHAPHIIMSDPCVVRASLTSIMMTVSASAMRVTPPTVCIFA